MRSYSVGAIVLGGHFHSLGLIRHLAKRGIKTVLLDYETNISRFSRHVYKYFKCPEYQNEPELLDFLFYIAKYKGLGGWVIFPSDDESVYFLSKNKEALDNYFRITTPGWITCKYVYNKKNTYTFAEKIGVSVPKTYYPECREDLNTYDLQFPVIIKPAVMRSFFKATNKKVFRVQNMKNLHTFYDQACGYICRDEVMIQEEIPDASNNLYSFCPFFKDGESLSYLIAKRHRQHPLDFGQASTYAETVDCPEIIEPGEKFLRAINYYGIGEVEFLQDPRDGIFKLLEVNPRIWGWHIISNKAGVDLFYYLYMDMIGMKPHYGRYQPGVRWMRLLTDVPTAIQAIIKKRLALKDYIRHLTQPKELAVFSKNDPIPFIVDLILAPYYWYKRGF